MSDNIREKRRELIRNKKINLSTTKERYIIKYLIMNDERVESFEWFANEVLGISKNTLSRKLGGSIRFFNEIELEIIRDFFAGKMNEDDYVELEGKRRVVTREQYELFYR